MMRRYILALDLGTTGNRAIIFDARGLVVASEYREFREYYPKPGWVEQDPVEIWKSTLYVMRKAVKRSGIPLDKIVAIGIANQRETTVVWNARTGKPLYRAIVWQDRRTADECARLKAAGAEAMVRRKTGLLIDPYFSATKVAWILDQTRIRLKSDHLRFGTIDSWILWRLTGGKVHATDVSNASRTMLFNIHTLKWDDERSE